jgi:hypothetical protein
LKGGEGGTFGVVTQATIRVNPNDPAVVTTMSISALRTNELFWQKVIADFLATLQTLNRDNIPGQLILKSSSTTSLEASLTLYFMNSTEISNAENRVKPHLTSLTSYSIHPKGPCK